MRASSRTRCSDTALRIRARRIAALSLAVSLALCGLVYADDTQVGANGANGIDAQNSHANGTDGGSGGPAIASDSATATDSTTTTATGGNGGRGGNGGKGNNAGRAGSGGAGGNATSTASINSNDFSLLSATANSFGGTGGAPGWSTGVIATAGHGGVGGNAISTALGLSTSDTWLRINSNATGGAGGSAFGSSNFGNGGAGGSARASSSGSSAATPDFLNEMFELIINAIATGGTGGSGYGAGFSGGAGGAAIIAPTSATGIADGRTRLDVSQIGGDGGAGLNLARGGDGASSFITDKLSATGHSYIEYYQRAVGGNGGNSFGALAGRGGDASSALTVPAHLDGGIPTAYAYATGGAGGAGINSVSGAGGNATGTVHITDINQYTIVGGVTVTGGAGGGAAFQGASVIGAAGGTATILNPFAGNSSPDGAAVLSVLATGGAGGDSSGPGNIGHDGALASIINARATSADSAAYVTAEQIGGKGGNGFFGANGGNGAPSIIINQVSGESPVLLQLSQTARGGAGGAGATGGLGGAATSSLAYSHFTSDIETTTSAEGGAGGNSTSANGRLGASATASSSITSAFNINSQTNSVGGAGGSGINGGAGGEGLPSPISATSTGGNVVLGASSTGGAGGNATGGSGISGTGRSVNLNNAASGNVAPGFQLAIAQTATGGNSGSGFMVAAPGSASSTLSRTAAIAGLSLNTYATGGNAGDVTASLGTPAAGAAASASSSGFNSTGYASIFASATAGNGFTDSSLNLQGGNGGNASATTNASTAGDNHMLYTVADARAGQAGWSRLSSGIGGNATASATGSVSGDSESTIMATAVGGNSGFAIGITTNGLAGGSGTSFASGSNENSTQTMNIQSFAEGGTGGQGFGAGRSGGIGGLANATASASSSTGAPIQINLTQRMGDGGDGLGGASGGNGRDSNANNGFTVSSNGPLTLAGESYGGNGGGSAGGAGGTPGNAFTNVSFSHTADLLTASNAYGGNGGLVTAGGTPKPGGNALASSSAITSSGSAAAGVRSTGGAGSNSDGATNAGNGGIGSLGSVYATSASGNVDVSGEVIGGFGGIAFGSGNAGHGGSVSTSNSIDGDAVPTSNIRFQLSATGGNGGISNSGSAGNGGNAQSSLSRTKNVQSLEVTTKSFGGWGGDRTSYFGAAGNGGNAIASASATNDIGTANADARAFGGYGGYGQLFSAGGNGGDASASTVSTGVGDTRASVQAAGGNGGASRFNLAGRGGNSTSSYTLNANGATPEPISAYVIAIGGNGGVDEHNYNILGGSGGNASSTVVVNSAVSDVRFARADSLSGTPGNYGQGGVRPVILGSFGDAVSNTIASAPGLVQASSQSNASHSELDMGGAAVSRTRATGTSGFDWSFAFSGGGIINHVGAEAMVTVAPTLDGAAATSETEARASFRGTPTAPSQASGFQAAAFITAMPHTADYRAAVASAPAVADAFTGVGGVLGIGLVGATSPAIAANSSDPYKAGVSFSSYAWHFDPTDRLLVGFTQPAITSSGFEQLDLSLSTEEGVLFARTFTSVSDAQAFFTNNVIDLGPIGSNHNVTDTNGISVSLSLTTHDASAGFNASFALGIASNRWTSNSSGDWDSPANWSHDAVPNNTYRSRVDFLNNNASGATHIRLNGDRGVGQLTFDNPSGYIIDSGIPGSRVGLNAGAAINVVSGNHRITAPVVNYGDLDINTSAGSSLTIDEVFNIYGFIIKKFGPGNLTLNSLSPESYHAPIAVAGGRLNLNFNLNFPDSFYAPSVIITGEGSKVVLGADQDLRSIVITTFQPGTQALDLASPNTPGAYRSLRFHADNLADLRPLLTALVNNASTNPGDGIFDSGLSSHANSAIGIAELLGADGIPYVLMRPTRIGDLNLDGQVAIDDLLTLASHLNQPGQWQEGDLNGDGQVTIIDFLSLAANFHSSYSGEMSPLSLRDEQVLSGVASTVPEPTTLLLPMVVWVFAARRRRK